MKKIKKGAAARLMSQILLKKIEYKENKKNKNKYA